MTVDLCRILAPFCFFIFDSSLKQFMYGKLSTKKLRTCHSLVHKCQTDRGIWENIVKSSVNCLSCSMWDAFGDYGCFVALILKKSKIPDSILFLSPCFSRAPTYPEPGTG